MASANTLTVPATRGKMGTTQYYTATFPLGVVTKLFSYDPDQMTSIPVEFRHQRALKKARVPDIAEYILDHEDYLFSSITVSVNSPRLEFKPSEINDDVGLLELPMDAEWIVNDGQHRVAGIAEAMKTDATLRYDHLSVVILPNGGLERSQQVFSDLNRTVQKTSKSLDILFDHRLPINRITNACVGSVPLFKGRTDKERVSLSIRAAQFATLSAVQAANTQLFGGVGIPEDVSDEEYKQLEGVAVEFWEYVTGLVTPWEEIAGGTIKPADARVDYLSSYALALSAVASAGHSAMKAPDDWKRRMGPLREVDWLKTNPEWQGICMQGGEIITRSTTRKAAADLLRWKIGLGEEPIRKEL
jgi:DNA sulfur modification protein DndB